MAGVGKGIVIPLSLNPRAWVDGMRVVDRSLRGMSDDLEQVEDAGDRLEKALADNFRDIERRARDVDFRPIGRSARDAADDTERAFDDIKEEGAQSAAETFASFDGSLSSIAEGFQEVAAQVSRIVPGIAGTIAGLAGAAGIGLVIQAYETWKQKQEEINQKAGEIIGTYREVGLALNDNTEKMITQGFLSEQSGKDMVALATGAAIAGQSVDDYVQSLLYGTGAQEELKAIAEQRLALEQDLVLANKGQTTESGLTADQLEAQIEALNSQTAILQGNMNLTKEERDALGLAADYVEQALAANKALNTEFDTGVTKTELLNLLLGEGATNAERIAAAIKSIPSRKDVTVSVTTTTSGTQLIDLGALGGRAVLDPAGGNPGG